MEDVVKLFLGQLDDRAKAVNTREICDDKGFPTFSGMVK